MDFGIRAKLFTSFGTLIALIAGVGFVGWQNTRQMTADIEDIYKNQLHGTVSLATSESNLWKLRYGIPQFLAQPEERSAIRTEEPKLYQRISQSLENYRNGELTAEEQKGLQKLEASYKRYIEARSRWFELVEAGKLNEAAEYQAKTTTPLGIETVQLLQEQINLQQQVGGEKHKQIVEKFNSLTILLIITLITALAIAIILSIFLGRNIAQVLLQSVKYITVTSSEIAATIDQQVRIAGQQASSVHETTTTMDELEASCRQSAQQAKAATTAAQQALTLAEDGTQAVGQALEGMFTLENKVTAIAEQIVHLSEQANQIASISEIVSDLTNQTNLLALNSSVEAVRAGEHGKGFAVVANEIRRLSDQSQKSADKINLLVSNIQKAINSTVMVTEEGIKTVKMGVDNAQRTDKAFMGVADAVNHIVVNNQQISLNLKQQLDAIQQVVQAMDIINRGAKETAIGITQTKSGTEQLSAVASTLKQMV